MKKLLFVTNNTNIGGPQKSLLALFDKLDFSQYEVDLLSLYPHGTLVPYYPAGVTILPTPALVTALTIPAKRPLHWLGVLLRHRCFRVCGAAVCAILRHVLLKVNMNRERQKIWQKYASSVLPRLPKTYDMAFGILGLSTYYVADCVQADKKFHWIRSDARILNRNTEIDAAYYEKMDGFLSVSKDCAAVFEDMFPLAKGRVKVCYNYIPLRFYERMPYDASLMAADEGTWKILTVCRLDPLKGIELAVDACRILLDRGVDLKWYVLGDGAFRHEVEAMIRAKRLTDRMVLLGFQMNTLKFIEQADIMVHPSRTEGKSNAVDEAKYAGKPIVVTNYATVGESIKDGVTGLICPMEGAAIADAVYRLMNDASLRQSLAENNKGKEDGPADIDRFFSEL